jgi:acyl carrier protein
LKKLDDIFGITTRARGKNYDSIHVFLACVVHAKKRIIINNDGLGGKRFKYFFYFRRHIFQQKLELKLKICIFAPILNFKTYKIMSDIASRVKAIIVDKLGVDDNEVTNEASFTNDLGADSLDTVELIMEFEKEFDIQIPDDQAENIGTVGQAISYIEDAKK